MELGTLLIVLIAFGLLSYVIEYITGFNPYQAYTLITFISILFSVFYIAWPVVGGANDLFGSVDRFSYWMINIFPGVLIGDVAGVFIANIMGGK